MSKNRRYQTHRKAKKSIHNLYDNSKNTLAIHYSCESFYNIKDGKTPRITSIAIRYIETGQTKSFSIHKVAELSNIKHNEIEKQYDSLEKEMLEDFFIFVKDHREFDWVHWNMRNINYGFEALNHRGAILKVKPYEIKDENKFDLSKLLIDKYGKNYAEHPRLESILKLNDLKPNHWLSGPQEALAFENLEYVKLHQSTLAKVGVISNILKLSAEKNFKTNSKKRDVYGLYPQGIYEMIKDDWLYSLIVSLISALLGAIIGKIIL